MPFGQKKRAFYAGLAYFSPFWCSAVTSVTFSSNLSNFLKNPNIPKDPKKSKSKKPKNLKNPKYSEIIPKNSLKKTQQNWKLSKNPKISRNLFKKSLYFKKSENSENIFVGQKKCYSVSCAN